jgi:hypothetical protein
MLGKCSGHTQVRACGGWGGEGGREGEEMTTGFEPPGSVKFSLKSSDVGDLS